MKKQKIQYFLDEEIYAKVREFPPLQNRKDRITIYEDEKVYAEVKTLNLKTIFNKY
ncbi:MAG: hypothetical protein Q7R52_02165 [archaeon]|nr:hypothetical protein [archaeon]